MVKVILINGISATGKTTLARQLAPRLGLPLFTKDDVKERLFDTVGVKDRAWAHQLSGATHAVLNYVLEELLKNGIGFIMEANFNATIDPEKYRRWAGRYAVEMTQIICQADGDVVYHRFAQRLNNGERHKGHCDDANLATWKDYLLNGRCEPMDLPGKVIHADTTNGVDIEALLKQLENPNENA